MKDNKYVARIVGYGNKIKRYLDWVNDFEEFNLNEEKVDDILLNIEIFGEYLIKLISKYNSKE